MRAAFGTISHETSTFTPVATTASSFSTPFGRFTGARIVEVFAGTNTPVGGFIEGAAAAGLELVPTLYAEAHPGGPISGALFEELVHELLDGIERALPVDGVLLDLHGAMVSVSEDDCEGQILERVRGLVGPRVPIVVSLDIHANVSHRMATAAEALVGRRTCPEVDMADTGRECVEILVRALRGEIRPVTALEQMPMVWGLNQVTDEEPMRSAIRRIEEIDRQPFVVRASLATGFSLADVPDMGASVFVVADADRRVGFRAAAELAAHLVERREEWQGELPTTREALERERGLDRYPVIFADRNDNTGGGAPGDGIGMVRTFRDERLEPACILYVVDPDAVAQCARAGVGATLELDVGGKSSPLQGPPIRMSVDVVALSDGLFEYDGPMYAGLVGNLGSSAWIREGGLNVVLVSEREQPYDTAFARSLGLDVRAMRYIGLKSTVHFRAAFGRHAAAIYTVGEPGVHASTQPNALVYRQLGRDVYPVT